MAVAGGATSRPGDGRSVMVAVVKEVDPRRSVVCRLGVMPLVED